MQEFLTYLDIERNVSINTSKSYHYDLDQFFSFWKKTEEDKKYTLDLNEALEQFFMFLYTQRIQKSSIARKIACFKSFEKYLHACDIDVYLNLTTPKIEKKLPTYLTVDEINFLLDKLDDKLLATKRPLRDRCILETLYATGIRCSELCNIQLNDIDFDQKTILITGKGDKQRIVLFNDITKQRLLQYIQIERIKDLQHNSFYLFLTQKGLPIQERSIQKILNKFSRQLPGKKNITPHKIRHSFATHLLNAGMDLRSLQELLGHSSLATTEKYTHIATKDLKELYTKINPLKLSED